MFKERSLGNPDLIKLAAKFGVSKNALDKASRLSALKEEEIDKKKDVEYARELIRKKHQREYMNEYNKRPEVILKKRIYKRERLKNPEYRKKYNKLQNELYHELMKNPEYREKYNNYQREYKRGRKNMKTTKAYSMDSEVVLAIEKNVQNGLFKNASQFVNKACRKMFESEFPDLEGEAALKRAEELEFAAKSYRAMADKPKPISDMVVVSEDKLVLFKKLQQAQGESGEPEEKEEPAALTAQEEEIFKASATPDADKK